MKYFFIIVLLFLVGFTKTTKKTSNENTSQETVLSNTQRLNFPSFIGEIRENPGPGCKDLYSQTPENKSFKVSQDTTIFLKDIDPRLETELKINWKSADYESDITDIDFIKNGEILSTLSLGGIIRMESFQDENDIYFKDVTFTDVNMDTYLDFSMTRQCGKGCWDSYFIYNPVKEIFEYEESWDWMRFQYEDCVGKIIYSYDGGVVNTQDWSAYKIDGNQLIIHQRLEQIHNKKNTLEVYKYYKNGQLIGSDSLKVRK